MRKWQLNLWTGFTNLKRIFIAENYYHACYISKIDGYPPGYIWSIEEI